MLRYAPLLFLALTTACQSPPLPEHPPETGAEKRAGSAVAEGGPEVAPSPASASVEDAAQLASIRKLLEAGEALEALSALDDYLGSHPEDAAGWMLLGEASMQRAPQDSRPNLVYADARDAFSRAAQLGADPGTWFRAADAARFALAPQDAKDLVDRGLAAVPEPSPAQLTVAAETHFDLYLAAKQGGAPSEELGARTEELLKAQIAAETAAGGTGIWGSSQLATYYEWEGELDAALALRRSLVQQHPEDEASHVALIGGLRRSGGLAASSEFYRGFAAEHRPLALVQWFAATEIFERGLEIYAGGEDASEAFEEAESLFREARAAQPEWTQRCLGYEVICRDGLGYSKMAADRLDEAEAAFFSMEELFPGGLDWSFEGRLGTGVLGLQYLAERGNRTEGNNLVGPGLDRAGRIYLRLHELRPKDANLANNAGYFHREIGVEESMRARSLAQEAAAAEDPEEKARLEREAAEQAEQARETLRICRDAYLAAAELAPDDVRIVNDAALILVYHFPSQADRAEELLLRAASNGAAQKDDPDLDPVARDLLLEAWGDANQNLGLLHLMLRDSPRRAKTYYRRALEIGPRPRVPRENIESDFLPMCDQAERGEKVDPRRIDPRIWNVETE